MFRKLILGAALAALSAGAANAGVVYSQASNDFGAFSSQNDTAGGGFGNFATVYDNFTLAASANLTSVDFTGAYYNPATQGAITAFTIKFYADLAGTPGSELYSTTISGTGSETALGTDTLGDLLFSYSENISFAAAGGTQYWLSIVPDVALPPQWGWENSAEGDGIGYQKFFGTLGPITSDSAFTLNGDISVPEPVSISIFAAGLAGLAVKRRRKPAKTV